MKSIVWARTGEVIDFQDLTNSELNVIWNSGPTHPEYKYIFFVDKTLNNATFVYSGWDALGLPTTIGSDTLFKELYDICLEVYNIESMPT